MHEKVWFNFEWEVVDVLHKHLYTLTNTHFFTHRHNNKHTCKVFVRETKEGRGEGII